MGVDQQLKKCYHHTFKGLLEYGCLPVCLCPAFWVARGLEVGMFTSTCMQKVNQRTVGLVWFCFALWHINYFRLFNAKSILYSSISNSTV